MTRIEEIKDKLTPLSVKSMSLDDARYLVSRIEAAEKLANGMKEMAKWCVRQFDENKCSCIPHECLEEWESGEAGLLRGRL